MNTLHFRRSRSVASLFHLCPVGLPPWCTVVMHPHNAIHVNTIIARDTKFFMNELVRTHSRLVRGLVEFVPITRSQFCAEEHRARVDGRATARHLHGEIERAARCLTMKVSAESAGAVASNVFFESLTTRQSRADSHNLMVVLAHLQGVAATFRAGRYHHRGPLHEGQGLTHALTHTAPTH